MPFTRFIRYFSVAIFIGTILAFVIDLLASVGTVLFHNSGFSWPPLFMMSGGVGSMLLAGILYQLCRLNESRGPKDMSDEELRQSILAAGERAAAEAEAETPAPSAEAKPET